MAGDHKCPVCQSTFTRPQHVARHMRSHTGDRPYKCQHCGDAFARSDLLSRHVNKCHSAEKAAAQAAAEAAGLPIPGKGRKGRSNVSSKAPCDQCIIAKLQCNSGEPCVKCVAKNIKCTYNQIDVSKAQHLPSLTLTQSVSRPRTSIDSASSASSGSYALDYSYGPLVPSIPRSAGDPNDLLFNSLSNSLPPQFAFSPTLYSSAGLDSPQHLLNEASSSTYYNGTQPGIGRDGRLDSAYSSSLHQPFAPLKYPYAKQQSQGNGTRTIYSSGANSAPESDVDPYRHQRVPPLQLAPGQSSHGYSLSGLPELSGQPVLNNDGRPQTAGEGGFSSAFGLMSLDDQAVLAGLATHQPFFASEISPSSAQGWQNARGAGDSEDNHGYTDVRAYWPSYMRTPSDRTIRKKNSDGYISSNLSQQTLPPPAGMEQRPDALSRRWSRRASLPVTKTPPKLDEYSSSYRHDTSSQVPMPSLNTNQSEVALNPIPQVGNRPDELRAYEQAILARGAPELKVDPAHLPRRSRILGHSGQEPSRATQHPEEPFAYGPPPSRHVLPPGRNAPFIGPQIHSTLGSPSENSRPTSHHNSHQNSPVRPQSHLSAGEHSMNPPMSQMRQNVPPPPQWETKVQRPKPKRNASQLLEQEMQKSLRPAGASDVTGDYDSYSGGTDDDYSIANYSPVSNSGSLSGHSRPSTAHSQSALPRLSLESSQLSSPFNSTLRQHARAAARHADSSPVVPAFVNMAFV